MRQLTDKRYGRLVARRFVGHFGPRKRIVWECQCDCGSKIPVRADNLESGNTTSCGCLGKYFERQKQQEGLSP